MIVDDGSPDQDLTAEMMGAMARIHERAASCMLTIEGAGEDDQPPPDLTDRLARLRAGAEGFVATYVPDLSEGPQPVAFDDDWSGWDFDPWMVEKTGSIESTAIQAHEEWAEIERRWAAGDRRRRVFPVEVEHGRPLPPTEREWVLVALHDVRRKAGIAFEMLDERLVAVPAGRGR